MHSKTMSRSADGVGLLRILLVMAVMLPVWVVGAAWSQEYIIINEVLANPASDWDGDGTVNFKDDEWIEVLNVGPDPIDLSDYFVRDILGEEPHLRLSGIIPPGGTAVFFGSDAVAWQTEMGMTTLGLSFNNSGDWVQLLRVYQSPEGPAFELMFVISYDPHEAEGDRSAGFNPDVSDWILFDSLNPYAGDNEPVGTGCAPSPGVPNLCGDLVASESRSFGQIKALFR